MTCLSKPKCYDTYSNTILNQNTHAKLVTYCHLDFTRIIIAVNQVNVEEIIFTQIFMVI